MLHYVDKGKKAMEDLQKIIYGYPHTQSRHTISLLSENLKNLGQCFQDE